MNSNSVNLSKEKLDGRFYTPQTIVNNILDLSGYRGQSILKKHVIDNSCGNGAFLVTIVNRYCEEFLKKDKNLQTLSQELMNYIHAIEINENEYRKCIENLNVAVNKFGLHNINWDITCDDALNVEKYNGKMDFVLGNPPYVRVHYLGKSCEKIKKFSFAQNGMTDLFIVFYEIGLNMLNSDGVLGYITPSSFFHSIACKKMRLHFVNNNLIDKIVDLKHFQAFSSTTYSAIAILKKNRAIKTTAYYQFEKTNNSVNYVEDLCSEDFFIRGNFYFAAKNKIYELKKILDTDSNKNVFFVKNGFATLADNIFIDNFNFDELSIPLVKASTGKRLKCFFPYSKGKLIPYEDLTSYPNIKNYLEENREKLLKRSLEKESDWYGFGRTQGIKDVYRCKYSVNTLIKSMDDIKLIKCEEGIGVYSGLYILTEVKESVLRQMLYCDDFISYITLLGKYKSGGYYTFSSKDLKKYLEYTYQKEKFKNE